MDTIHLNDAWEQTNANFVSFFGCVYIYKLDFPNINITKVLCVVFNLNVDIFTDKTFLGIILVI